VDARFSHERGPEGLDILRILLTTGSFEASFSRGGTKDRRAWEKPQVETERIFGTQTGGDEEIESSCWFRRGQGER